MRQRAPDAAVLALGAVLLALLCRVWLGRIGHPYDLEWMEGGMLSHAWRLQQGLPLYVPPGPDFIPFVYPPGYAAVVAAASLGGPLTPALGRAISLLGALVAAAALGAAVHRQTSDRVAAVAAGLVFLGAYPGSGAFYDLVRPDGLAIGLLGLALALGLDGRRGTAVCCGLFLAAAFLVKQHTAAFGLPIAAGLWLRGGWREAARFTAASALPALLATGWLQLQSDGRFLQYLLAVPAAHPLIWHRALPGVPRELGAPLPVAAAACGLWLVLSAPRRVPPALAVGVPVLAGIALATWAGMRPAADVHTGVGTLPAAVGVWAVGAGAVAAAVRVAGRGVRSWRWVYGVGVAAVAVGVTAMMRAHNGGFLNVLMPLHWVCALGLGLAAARARAHDRLLLRRAGTAALAAQLAWSAVVLDADKLLPGPGDRAAGDRIVAELEAQPGPVLSPFAAWLPVYAGHPPSLHYMALWDLDTAEGPLADGVSAVDAAVREQHWPAVLLGSRAFGHDLQTHYARGEDLLSGEDEALWPRSGWKARPVALATPRGDGG